MKNTELENLDIPAYRSETLSIDKNDITLLDEIKDFYIQSLFFKDLGIKVYPTFKSDNESDCFFQDFALFAHEKENEVSKVILNSSEYVLVFNSQFEVLGKNLLLGDVLNLDIYKQ